MSVLLSQSREASARIRVENIIQTDVCVELMEMLELYAEVLLARAGLLDTREKDKKSSSLVSGGASTGGEPAMEPTGLEEAAAALIYAAPRLPREIRELAIVRGMLVDRFGKDFATKCSVDGGGGLVPERVVERLKVQPPSSGLVEAYLREIARTYAVDWPKQVENDEGNEPLERREETDHQRQQRRLQEIRQLKELRDEVNKEEDKIHDGGKEGRSYVYTLPGAAVAVNRDISEDKSFQPPSTSQAGSIRSDSKSNNPASNTLNTAPSNPLQKDITSQQADKQHGEDKNRDRPFSHVNDPTIAALPSTPASPAPASSPSTHLKADISNNTAQKPTPSATSPPTMSTKDDYNDNHNKSNDQSESQPQKKPDADPDSIDELARRFRMLKR